LGIVYGDIGTSPLYAMDQLFSGRASAPTAEEVLGGISLVIWTITIIVAVKYAIVVLRAQNDGEGGLFALYGLLHEQKKRGTRPLLWVLMLGAGLLFGDGMITPAISVVSAVEGLQVVSPDLSHMIVPITVGLLTVLFAIQYKGTAGIGIVFGPVLIVWFVVIAALGAWQIGLRPEILAAFNPLYGFAFLQHVGVFDALVALGALMLVVTGGEAMYADLGHFGAQPIRAGWFGVVYPALLLNYLGQGAYLLSGAPIAGGKLFFNLVPPSLLFPMIALATMATVIASQALISGAFSLASQAVRLGLFPRINLLHTHERHAGQVYVPFVNWSLLAGCVLLIAAFGSSAALAPALTIAVAGVTAITSLAMVPIARLYWGWGWATTLVVWGALIAINLVFLLATLLNVLHGGYVPLLVGVALLLVMATWRWGRKATFAAYSAKSTMTMAELVDLHRGCSAFMERNAVVMAAAPLRLPSDRTPAIMQMQSHLRRSHASQGALHPGQPLSRHGLRPRSSPWQHRCRGSQLRLHGRTECRTSSGRNGAAQTNRFADRPPPVGGPCLPGKSVAVAADELAQAGAFSSVSAAAHGFAARLLLLRPWRRSAVIRRDHPGAGAIGRICSPAREAVSARAFSATPCCHGRQRRRTARPGRHRSAY
jgi:KUP system potassium uptake protein